jgi:hypothetical protein
VFGGTVIQRLGISVGKLFNTILFFSLQIVPAFQLGLTLRAHQPLLSCFAGRISYSTIVPKNARPNNEKILGPKELAIPFPFRSKNTPLFKEMARRNHGFPDSRETLMTFI